MLRSIKNKNNAKAKLTNAQRTIIVYSEKTNK